MICECCVRLQNCLKMMLVMWWSIQIVLCWCMKCLIINMYYSHTTFALKALKLHDRNNFCKNMCYTFIMIIFTCFFQPFFLQYTLRVYLQFDVLILVFVQLVSCNVNYPKQLGHQLKQYHDSHWSHLYSSCCDVSICQNKVRLYIVCWNLIRCCYYICRCS